MLKQLLEKLLCKHRWEVHQSVDVYWGRDTGGAPYKIRKILICQNCGKIKKIEI